VMSPTLLRVAIGEAHRFIARAEAAKQRLERDENAYFGSPQTAAVKRASMDLTKVLAEIRK